MTERRRVTRRESITVETDSGEFEANPLPWQDRNDLGDFLIQTYVASISAMVGAINIGEDGQTSGGTFDEKAIDWFGLLERCFPSVDRGEFDRLDIWEMRVVILASLEVNGMEHLGYMLDPNLRSPEAETTTSLVSDGQKITSIQDSGSPGTPETKSES